MLKLRKLIKEHTWDREFGDPLVTFEDVMKKHQVNKFKEDLDSVGKEDDDVDNDGDSDASDDYLKNRRDVISKAIEKESIKEYTWDREFGDPLVTFEDVMKKHQVNKLKEDWWDDMDSASQAAYIKKHPGSQQAQSAKDTDGDEDDYDMGEVPGSRGTGPWTPEDDPDFEHGPSLTSAPGRVPDEKPSGGQQAVDDSRQKAVQSGMALKNAEGEFGKDSSEYGDAKRADDEAQGEYQQAKASQEQRQKDINSGKVEPETKEEAEGAASDARDSVEKQKQNRAYALQQPDPRDPRSPAEQEAGWDKTVADAEERAGEAEAKAKEFGAGRTGNELNQETLTIDGKQFRRISEGVEQKPKSKYEFSEFYKRFKK